MSRRVRKKFLLFLALMVMVCPSMGLIGSADAARLELRGRATGTAGEVRIPLNQSGTIDVWLDAEGERLRTLNLYLRYDPTVIRPLDAHSTIDGVNPFVTASYMPVPDEVFNAALEEEGELYYAVTNGGDAAATGSGVVASFRVEAFSPKLSSEIERDFRFPLNFTSYQILNDDNHLEDGDFERSDVVDIRISIGEGLEVSDIPNFQLAGGEVDRSLVLDDFVADAIFADDEINWDVSGHTNVEVFIDPSRRVTLEAPSNWSGVEELLFTATSPDDLTASDLVQVTVIGPPRLRSGLSALPDIVMAEDTQHDQFDLDDYVAPDTFNPVEELSWFASGQAEIQVQIDSDSHHLTLTPSANWHGEETIVFRVMNQLGLVDTIGTVVTVFAINDPPEIFGLEDVMVLVNEEVVGPSLEEFTLDVDNDLEELSAFVAGDSIASAEFRDGRIVIAGLQAGTSQVRLAVQDNDGERVEANIQVTVIERFFPPTITGLVDTTLYPGERVVFDLNASVEDVDTPDSLLTWRAESVGGPIVVELDAALNAILTPIGSAGIAQVRFTVTDQQGNADSVDVTVTILDAPLLVLPDVELIAGRSRTLELADGIVGIDAGLLTWSLEVNEADELRVSLDAVSGTLTLIADSLLVSTPRVAVMARTETGVAVGDTFAVAVVLASAEYTLALIDTVFDAGTSLVLDLAEFSDGVLPLDLIWESQLIPGNTITADLDSVGGILELAAAPDVVDTILVAIKASAPLQEAVRDSFVVEVTALVDLVLQLSDTTIVAGTTLELNLNDFTTGRDPGEMIWSTGGTFPTGVTVILDSLDGALTVTTVADLSGSLNLEISVRTNRDDPISQTLRVNVVPPRMVLPVLELVAGSTNIVDLTEYVPVVDPAELTWELEGDSPTGVTVELEAETGRLVLTVAPGLSDTLFQSIVARHTSTLVLRDTLEMNVISQRFALGKIPDLEIVAGDPDTSLALDSYVTAGDPEALTWSVAGAAVIAVDIDPLTRRARISAPDGFAGEETLLFTAQHASGEQVSTVVRVIILAPPPDLLLADIPDVVLIAGDSLTVALNAYVSVGDTTAVTWSVAATFVEVAIDPQTSVARLRTTDPAISGQDVLLFTAMDKDGNTFGDLVRVTVNPRLMLAEVGRLSLTHGESARLLLDELVTSGRAALLEWSVSGAAMVMAEIDGEIRELVLRAPPENLGEEVLTLTTVSADGQSVSTTVVVAFAPAPLEFAEISAVTLVAGSDTTLVLNDLLISAATQITWSAAAPNLTVTVIDSLLRIQAPAGFTGVETVTLTASVGEETAAGALEVTVIAAMALLQVGDIPDFDMVAGAVDSSLFLDAFLQIGDPALVEWSVSGGALVDVHINSDSRRVRLQAGAVAGIDTLLFTATQGDSSASDAALVRIAEPPPELELVDVEVEIRRGTVDSTLVLSQFLAAGDVEAVAWTVVGGGRVIASTDATGRLLLDAREALSGRELFTVEARDGEVVRLALLTVSITAPLFSIADLPSLEIEAGALNRSIDLDLFVEGDFALEDISWSATSGPEIGAAVDPGSHVLELLPAADFSGIAQVLLTASTPLQDSIDVALRLNVLGPPSVLPLPDLFMLAGTDADVLDLDDYSDGSDPLVWRVVDEGEVTIVIDQSGNLLRLSIPESSSGLEVRQLAARRSTGALEQVVQLSLNIKAISRPPVLLLPEKVIFAVGESVQLDLDTLIDDEDTADDMITWSVTSQWQELELELSSSRRLLLSASGVLSLNAIVDLRAVDPEGNIAFGDFRVEVVNLDADPPDLVLIPHTHEVFAELVNIDVFTNETLADKPRIQLDGQPVSVSDRGDHFTAVLTIAEGRILQVGATAMDVAGNSGSAQLQIAVELIGTNGGSVASPDGRAWMNIPGGNAPRLGLLYAAADPESDMLGAGKRATAQAADVYRMEVSGFDGGGRDCGSGLRIRLQRRRLGTHAGGAGLE